MGIRITLPQLIHGSTPKSVRPWFMCIDEDYEQLEIPDCACWSDVRDCRLDLEAPERDPSGYGHRLGVPKGRFWGSVVPGSSSALGDALLGRRKWTGVEVLRERNLLLGSDCQAARRVLPKRRPNNSLTDELLLEIERELERADESTLGTIQSETIGIDPAWRIQFMKEMAANVEVLQIGGLRQLAANANANTNNAHLVELAGNAVAVAATATVTATVTATRTPTSQAGDDELTAALTLKETETATFCSLSSTNTASYDEAKRLFDVDGSGGVPCVGRLTLKPWQVIGVKWMMDQEKSPKPCKEEGSTDRLSFAPPAVIQTWIDECTDYFSDIFTMRVFYSGRSQAPSVRDAALSRTEMKNLWGQDGVADCRSPATSQLLLVTTCETLARRSRSVDSSDDDDDDDDDDHNNDENDAECGVGRLMWIGRFARVVCDEGHKIRGEED
ncbi:hypothetical protein GP486_003293 [Trichoglossum hirsutum]|uniref:Uncharacterized protein n=1 Tax=Trichoglossum hirsutum TaxID=265104 RepID=A0A9P8LDB9_9PEZI|nr:hypothetical protein GP486_003293 [Trichoglossum hirsutum]